MHQTLAVLSVPKQRLSLEAYLTYNTAVVCCRLFSSAHFNDTFPEHTPPEILNTSLEGLVLLMKAMHVDKVGSNTAR